MNGKVSYVPAFDWTYLIHNYGSVPAYQADVCFDVIINGVLRNSYNLTRETIPKTFEWDSQMKPTWIKDDNLIIPPEGDIALHFQIATDDFKEMMTDPSKSGINFRVDYAGPWNEKGQRPFYYETQAFLWNNDGHGSAGYADRYQHAN